MGNHRDNLAPLRGRIDQRRVHFIARFIGVLALAGFMVTFATGTARAGVLGEIVDELPVDIGLGQADPAPAEPGPNGLGEVVEVVVEETGVEVVQTVVEVVQTVVDAVETPVTQVAQPEVDAVETPVTQVIQPVVDAVETPVTQVAQPVVDAVETPVTQVAQPVVDAVETPVTQVAQPVVDAVETPVTQVIQPVVDAVETPVTQVAQPVVDAVEAPVAQVVEQVAPVVSGIAEPLSPVVEPALDLIGGTVGTLPGVIDQVPDPLLDVINGLVNVPGLITGIEDLVENLEEPGGGLFDPPQPVIPDMRSDDNEATVTSPPVARGAPRDTPHVAPGGPGLAETSPIPTHLNNAPASSETTAPASTRPRHLLDIAPEILGRAGSPPVDYQDIDVAIAPHLAVASTAPASSNSGPTGGLVAVLVLLGLIAPRLSRWLRPRPVLWRPIALAEALALPG